MDQNDNLIKHDKYDYYLKAILIGDSAVGKTCISLRYIDNKFSSTFIATIGVDFQVKILNYDNQLYEIVGFSLIA